MGTIVAGVDFGTLNVRVSIFDSEKGRLGAGVAEYPLHRKKGDPDHATQSHDDHMQALAAATRRALADANVDGKKVAAIALDTTGSSVVPVGENLVPLDEYYLWCDHRAWREAAEITRKAHEYGLQAIEWCGGAYSSEWGFSKLLHWLRHNPEKRERLVSAFEHCDLVAAVFDRDRAGRPRGPRTSSGRAGGASGWRGPSRPRSSRSRRRGRRMPHACSYASHRRRWSSRAG